MPVVQAHPTTQQTNTALVSATADRVARVLEIFVSTDTAITFSLENSTTHGTEILVVHMAANSHFFFGSENDHDLFLDSIEGEGIDYSTSAGSDVFIKVSYEAL